MCVPREVLHKNVTDYRRQALTAADQGGVDQLDSSVFSECLSFKAKYLKLYFHIYKSGLSFAL